MGLSSNNKTKVEGGMASMTDLVFLLLIFFIIMALMSNDQITVDLPESRTDLPAQQERITPTVVVTEEGLYMVVGENVKTEPLEFEEMKETAASIVMESGETKLKVAGHRNASYEDVFQALALCQANGWDPVLAYDK